MEREILRVYYLDDHLGQKSAVCPEAWRLRSRKYSASARPPSAMPNQN